MEKTYTYNPEKICLNGLDQMRFELGDTSTEGREKTCALCDEEYLAILKGLEKGKSWKNVKIHCLEAILAKLSYEVNYEVDQMRIGLSDKYKHCKELLAELKKSGQIPSLPNTITPEGNQKNGGHYFTLGMQENPYAK